jgi:malonyl-CoA/methylmalonyl-CoA synthetase
MAVEVSATMKSLSACKVLRMPLFRGLAGGADPAGGGRTHSAKHCNSDTRASAITSFSAGKRYMGSQQAKLSIPYKVKQQFHEPVFRISEDVRANVAVSDRDGEYLYEDVYQRSFDLALGIQGILGPETVHKNICFFCPNGVSYVLTLWACWMSGNVAVPLAKTLNEDSLEFQIQDSGCSLVITTKDLVDKIHPITKKYNHKLIVLDETWVANPKKSVDTSKPLQQPIYSDHFYTIHPDAMVLYTSGTGTGKHKGVTFKHGHLSAQIAGVSERWELTEKDSVLHTLPLNNIYGIINSIMAPLKVGGRVVMLPQFDTVKVWSHLLGIGVNTSQPVAKVNMFPSVPTHYIKLMERYQELFQEKKMRDYVRRTLSKRIRLMTNSGSSLPASLPERWSAATGHTILAHYWKTEVGTILSGKPVKPGAKASSAAESQSFLPLADVRTRIVRFENDDKTKYEVMAECHSDVSFVNPRYIGKEIVGELMVSERTTSFFYILVEGNRV